MAPIEPNVPHSNPGQSLEEALQQVEIERRQLEAVIEQMGVGVIVADPAGRFVTVNAEARRLLGEVGQGLDDLRRFTFSDGRGREWPLVEAISQGQVISPAELTARRPDGSEVLLNASAAPLRDATGAVTGGVLLLQDDTTRRRLEAALRESETRYREIYNLAPVMYHSLDAQARILDCSDYELEVLGYRREEYVGRNIFDFYAPEMRATGEALFASFRETGWVQGAELQVVRKNGSRVDILLNARARRDASGRVTGSLGTWQDITERKQLERELKAALDRIKSERNHLEAILNQMNEAVIACDRQGRLTLFNPAAQRIHGFGIQNRTLDELARQKDMFLPGGAPLPPDQYPLRRALERQEAISGHLLRIRRDDGSESFVRVNATPVYDGDGVQIGAVAVSPDVSEEIERKAQIEAERQKLSAIIANLQVGVSFFSPGHPTRLLRINKRGLEILGFSSIEEMHQRIEQGAAPTNFRNLDGRPLSYEFWPRSRAARGETFSGLEYLWERSDGRLARLSVAGCGIFDPQGRLTLGVTVYRDVTEERERERMLVETEGKLRALFEALPVGVLVADDLECRSLTLTSAAARILGLEVTHISPEELLARVPILDERGQTEGPLALDQLPLQRAIREDRRIEGEEIWHRTASGREVCLLINAAPVHDVNGIVTGGVAAFQDITERKLLVEHLVEANRMKDQFLAMLSHELRTPLTPVLGWVRVLRKGGAQSPETLREAIDAIERNVTTQARLIDDLLDMSRIANRKITLKLEALDLREVIGAALQTVEPPARAKEIQLTAMLGSLPIIVKADAVRLQQVMWNLLANAIKFTPKGGQVTVSAEARTGVADVVVTDTGVGIRPEFLPYIFDVFRQGEGEALRRTHGGLGLGLAIARSLVELHGGSVHAESEGTGRGSRFIVRLPLAMLAPEVMGEAQSQDGESLRAAEKVKVLVVDDSRDTLVVTRLILEQEGCEVLAAATGKAALTLLDQTRPQVMILDIGLPDMTGYDLLRRARELPHLKQTPAIALTGYGMPEDKERALEAGFARHLTKPLDYGQLVNLIRELSASRRRDGQEKG